MLLDIRRQSLARLFMLTMPLRRVGQGMVQEHHG